MENFIELRAKSGTVRYNDECDDGNYHCRFRRYCAWVVHKEGCKGLKDWRKGDRRSDPGRLALGMLRYILAPQTLRSWK